MFREPEGKPKGETRHEKKAAKTASGGHGRAKAKRGPCEKRTTENVVSVKGRAVELA